MISLLKKYHHYYQAYTDWAEKIYCFLRVWLNTALGKFCQNELWKQTDRDNLLRLSANKKGVCLELYFTQRSILTCVFFFFSFAATSCGDIQHHRQVSVLPNLHQPFRLLPRPEEVEVQLVLSGQRRYERERSVDREVFVTEYYLVKKTWGDPHVKKKKKISAKA